jgi:D-alanyl-D-alanine carboxypeptidase (penicillin-binding protein 5/6)
VLMPILTGKEVSGEVVYTGPITAPIQQGQPIAELVIAREGLPDTRVPLVAETAVPHGGFLSRVSTAGQILLGRIIESPEGAM